MDSKKRGRPPGSRNKIRGRALTDYGHSDPDTICARQLTMLEAAQKALQRDLEKMVSGDEKWVDVKNILALEKLSNAIVRGIEAMKKSADLGDELASRLSPEQLLEAAIKKIEAQDLPTLKYAIKRLRAKREQLTPTVETIDSDTAAGAIAGLA